MCNKKSNVKEQGAKINFHKQDIFTLNRGLTHSEYSYREEKCDRKKVPFFNDNCLKLQK